MAELPNVSLRILPFRAGPYPGAVGGSFVILDFSPEKGRSSAEPSVVYSESLTGAIYLDKPSELAAYEEAWKGLAAIALDEGESSRLISKIIGELGHE